VLALAGAFRRGDVIENQVPLVERVVRPGKLHRAAAIVPAGVRRATGGRLLFCGRRVTFSLFSGHVRAFGGEGRRGAARTSARQTPRPLRRHSRPAPARRASPGLASGAGHSPRVGSAAPGPWSFPPGPRRSSGRRGPGHTGTPPLSTPP